MSFYRLLSASIDVLISLVTTLLGLRVLLKLFGANEANALVQAVYTLSQPLLAPFTGMFPSLTLESGFVLEFAPLFALVIYAIIAHILLTIIRAAAYAAFRRRYPAPVRPQVA